MKPAPASPGLARLRGEFLESLAQRVAELERLSRALDGSAQDGDRLTTLYREAQALAQARVQPLGGCTARSRVRLIDDGGEVGHE